MSPARTSVSEVIRKKAANTSRESDSVCRSASCTRRGTSAVRGAGGRGSVRVESSEGLSRGSRRMTDSRMCPHA